MTSYRKRGAPVQVAIELCRSNLHVAILDGDAGGSQRRLRTRSTVWRHEASRLESPEGQAELTAALGSIARELQLSGSRARISLGGGQCVTRVAMGSLDQVRRELRFVQQRSNLYLALGTGAKSWAESVHAIDARHFHGLLTVTNQKTVEAIIDVAAQCGLQLERIESSLVALSRLAGACGHDSQGPVLIVNLDDDGVELGISHGGRLLLDYRAGGRIHLAEVAPFVASNIARLRRWIARYYGFEGGPLDKVLVFGPTADVAAAVPVLAGSHGLTLVQPTLAATHFEWHENEIQNAQHDAPANWTAIGTLLAGLPSEPMTAAPNLLDGVARPARQRLLRSIARPLWPAAAAALASVCMWGLSLNEQFRCDEILVEIQELEPAHGRAWQLRNEQAMANDRISYLKRIAARAGEPAWHDLITTVAQCLPDGAWLDGLLVRDGRLTISGTSYGDDGVYQFARYLEQVRALSQVAIDGTTPARFRTHPATKFDVECDIVARNDSSQ